VALLAAPATGVRADYQWAVVIGGAPSEEAADGTCATAVATSPFQVNGVGLWLFSRKAVDPEATAAMRAVLDEAGVNRARLRPVEHHEGCSYEA
jgi:hypothetical protein